MTGFAPVTAVVLAGGARDGVCRDDPDAINKAFVRVNGIPLITHALRALREATHIREILVVTPSAAPSEPLKLADGRREAGPEIADSIEAGFFGLDPDALALLCASDLPALTSAAVDDFVERAQFTDCDIAYGYIEQSLHDARYPEIRHTWARFREGVFCGTGLCAIRPRALPALRDLLRRASAARKRPWRLASLLGAPILVRYALGILGIHEVEERASALIGRRARGIASRFPEIAVNIDRYSDLRQFRNAKG